MTMHDPIAPAAPQIEGLFAAWQKAQAHAEGAGLSDDECTAACQVVDTVAARMLDVPPVTAADLARQIVAVSHNGGHGLSEHEFHLNAVLWASLRRLAGAA